MKIEVLDNPITLGKAAGSAAAQLICNTVQTNGSCTMIMATGTSQFETINQLIREKDIDWSKVILFHLDEYIGLPVTAAASFRKYIRERFLSKVPPLQSVYLIDGEVDVKSECERLGEIITRNPVDIALVGVGENGHLAFNDPPADFKTEIPFLDVTLNEACRVQQWNEGWFTSLEKVPFRAISMSIQQILKSAHIICSVPGTQKAVAVKYCLEGTVTNVHPASILQTHKSCAMYLDEASAALLTRSAYA